ncbi:MAG: DUF4054 domain-containing protein [Hellea sp.]|nr:DUF4054 domain-containing protein [Hellea sp.]
MGQPSLSAFLARFPEFGRVEHGVIVAVLAEAPLYVDQNWGAYEELGAMLYTAHTPTMQGFGESAAARFENSRGVTSITSGSHKIIYADSRGAVGFEASPHGQRFEALTRRLGAKLVSIL